MSQKTALYTDPSFFPPNPISRKSAGTDSTVFGDSKPPRKPDWLLIFVSILFLLSLLIAWLVDAPNLLR